MQRADLVAPSPDQLSNLRNICNETAIYGFLFKERLHGREYSIEDARDFLSWATRGWTEQTHFVFLLTAVSGLVAGALDIKSSERSMAEVGYWCSQQHRGLMTAAVGALRELAREAGYQNLFARVRKDNPASIKVLERNKFLLRGDWEGDATRSKYSIELQGSL